MKSRRNYKDIVFPRQSTYTYSIYRLTELSDGACSQYLKDIRRRAPLQAPRMLCQLFTAHIRNAYELILLAGRVNQTCDCDPYLPTGRLRRSRGLAANPQHRPHFVANWFPVPPEEYYGRRAVPRDIGAGSVNDMR